MTKNTLLQIKNLYAELDNKRILQGLDLEIPSGQIHVIMGPNGSGKSTLAKIIMGVSEADITKGDLIYKGRKINKLETDQRAKLGIFLANQYPVEVPGVNLANFLRIAYNAKYKNTERQLSPIKFRELLQERLKLVGLDKDFAERNLNEGFSGGEKKKCEILQMALLEPELAILDETDSGLDVDALKQIFTTVNKIKQQSKSMSLLIITHYERIFNYIKPDKIHILQKGKIQKSGSAELLKTIDKHGFAHAEK